MKKQFTLLQLFSVLDERLSTTIDDVYDILNHICDEDLMTHHLPVALKYLKLKNPSWFQEQKKKLETIAKTFYTPVLNNSTFNSKDVPFKDFISAIEHEYNDNVNIPQLKDEFDTSDFGQFMIDNSLLNKG